MYNDNVRLENIREMSDNSKINQRMNKSLFLAIFANFLVLVASTNAFVRIRVEHWLQRAVSRDETGYRFQS